MTLTRKELVQLALLIAAALISAQLLQDHGQLGENVGQNPLVREIEHDTGAPSRLNPGADLNLIVFSDYRCPACRLAYPALKRAVERDGRVRLIYREWPIFGPFSERAAEVAIGSSFQGIYPAVHDRLMTGPVGSEADLRRAVEESGGNWSRLQRDLVTRRAEIARQLSTNQRYAFGLGLGGTPGYLAGPVLVRGALSEREFARLIGEARRPG